jgi:hypothetical protein
VTEDTVVLELGEGFKDDEVTVLLDGQEIWHRRGVTTNWSVGIAEVVPLPPSTTTSRLEVRTHNLSGSASLTPTRDRGEVRLRADIDDAGAGLTVGPAPGGARF